MKFKKINVLYEIVDFFRAWLYFAQNFLRKATFANLVPRVLTYHHGNEVENLLEVARTAKSCSKRQKMLKSCRAQSGKA